MATATRSRRSRGPGQENLRPAAAVGTGDSADRSASTLVLTVLALVFILPLLWMLSTSFKTAVTPPACRCRWIPNPFTLPGLPAARLDDVADTR